MANFFGNNAPQQPPQQPNQQQPNQQYGGQLKDNGGDNQQAHQATQQSAIVQDNKPPAPMDSFKSLWENTTKSSEGPKGVLPQITAEQLSTTLANSNFLSGIDPEVLKRASSGDSAAFSDVINQGLRTVMTQSVLASHGLVEAGARGQSAQWKDTLPSMVRSSNVQDALSSNSVFSNPAAKPMVELVRAQLESKHPQASAKEIAELTQQFIGDFAKLATPPETKQQDGGRSGGNDTDWYAALGLGPLKQ